MKRKNIKKIEEIENIDIMAYLREKQDIIRIFDYNQKYLELEYIDYKYLFMKLSMSNYVYNILKNTSINSLDSKTKKLVNNYLEVLYNYLFQNPSLL